MIVYPRKCSVCGYEANNPAMWSYHAKTHEPIPTGKLCDMGCGHPAKFVKTSGKFTCKKITQQCPAYVKRHAEDVKRQWTENVWADRRQANADRTQNETSEQRKQRAEKQRRTKRQKRLATENSFDRRKYNRAVTYHSNKTYERHQENINPRNLPIGRQQHHIDHKVSKFVGWVLNIPVDILSHENNLCVLEHRRNSGKQHRCSAHPIELLEVCGASESVLTEARSRLHLVEHLIP